MNQTVSDLQSYVDKASRLSGWKWDVDISRVGPDWAWDYVELARRHLREARSILDMGTGGGERLASMIENHEGRALATEAWPPNVRVAAERLAPLGASVVHASSLDLPLTDGGFELVLNRHEELDCSEVARVLASGGRLFTQQVGRSNWQELGEFFSRMQDFGPLFEEYRAGFSAAGLDVVRADTSETRVAFGSLGDVVYALTAAPWTVPDFSLERDIDALVAFERKHGGENGILMTESRFVIEATKS